MAEKWHFCARVKILLIGLEVKSLHLSAKTGKWECPDFFLVSIDNKDGAENYFMKENTKFVLKASFLDRGLL